MTAVQDMQELDTAEAVEHGSECFCQICKPQIVDEEPAPAPLIIYVAS